MKMLYQVSIILLLVSFTYCHETKEEISKRYKFYSSIKERSSHKIAAGIDKEKGIYCKAIDHISANSLVLTTPMKESICPYYMFPFKFEIVKALYEVKGLDQSIGKEQKFSVYILVFNIMYNLYANKPFIKKYIEDNNIEAYKDINFDDFSEVKDTFPKVVLGRSTLDQDHIQYLINKELINESVTELELVHNIVSRNIALGDYTTAIYHWIHNINHFKHAYGIAMSRSMTLRLNEYYNLVNLKENQSKYSKAQLENLKLNQKVCQTVGCPCIILFIDLCNHYQPKFKDGKDKRTIILDTIPGSFVNYASKEYDIDDEVSFTYTNEPNSLSLFLHYGFVIKNNIFNTFKSKVVDHYTLTTNQFNICKELNCVDISSKGPYGVQAEKIYHFNQNVFNEQLLTYAKIRSLSPKESEDTSKIIRYVRSNKSISFYNDIASWMFYLKKVFTEYKHHKASLTDSINEAQFYRNTLKNIENDWKETEEVRTNWRRFKQYEQIAELDISFKIIIPNQVIAAEKKLIKLLHDDIMNIKKNLIS